MKKVTLLMTAALLLILSACSNYGTKLKVGDEDELYYTDKVTEDEAKKMGDFLLENKILFVNDGNTVSAQMDKDGDVVIVRFVVQEKFFEDKTIHNQFQMIADMLSFRLYNGGPVEAHICNDKLKTQKAMKSNKFSEEDLNTPL